MSAYKSMIDELEEAVASKEIGRRADTLRRITDLFVSGSAAFSDDQIALFDDVMNLLARRNPGIGNCANQIWTRYCVDHGCHFVHFNLRYTGASASP